jgi:hypothetical protein
MQNTELSFSFWDLNRYLGNLMMHLYWKSINAADYTVLSACSPCTCEPYRSSESGFLDADQRTACSCRTYPSLLLSLHISFPFFIIPGENAAHRPRTKSFPDRDDHPAKASPAAHDRKKEKGEKIDWTHGGIYASKRVHADHGPYTEDLCGRSEPMRIRLKRRRPPPPSGNDRRKYS